MSAGGLSVLVFDIGASTAKAGFGGDTAPRSEIPSRAASLRHPGTSGKLLGALGDNVVGQDVDAMSGLLTVSPVANRGKVTDWDALMHLWHSLYIRELAVAPEEHPLLLAEPAATDRRDREKLIEMAFESFNCPAVAVANASALALFSTGRSTGIVVDVGASRTDVGVVWEGYAMPHHHRRLALGGADLSELLRGKLRADGYPLSTAADLALVDGIKESLCYVAPDAQKEEELSRESRSIERMYELPDGQQIYVNAHRFTTPEALLHPELAGVEIGEGTAADPGGNAPTQGIHRMAFDAAMACGEAMRPELLESIVLAGGSSLFPGLDLRLQKEVAMLAPRGTAVRAVSFPSRKYAVWVGGSVFASMPTFACQWVSKNEYDDYGSTVIHRKS